LNIKKAINIVLNFHNIKYRHTEIGIAHSCNLNIFNKYCLSIITVFKIIYFWRLTIIFLAIDSIRDKFIAILDKQWPCVNVLQYKKNISSGVLTYCIELHNIWVLSSDGLHCGSLNLSPEAINTHFTLLWFINS